MTALNNGVVGEYCRLYHLLHKSEVHIHHRKRRLARRREEGCGFDHGDLCFMRETNC